LNCNKVKQSKASKDDIIKALEQSSALVILPDRTGVKRKSDTVPDLEPKFNKKNKSNSGDDGDDKAAFKEYFSIFMAKIKANVQIHPRKERRDHQVGRHPEGSGSSTRR
jgi:hypothetical protein